MNRPLILRFRMLLLALIVLMTAGTANAASILVGVDQDPLVDDPYADNPPAIKYLAPGESVEVRLYLHLEDEEVASLIQADFDLAMSGDYTVDLDFTTGDNVSEVNPGIPDKKGNYGPPGTWPNTEGQLTSSLASISLTSGNTGGTRLVARLDITRVSDNPDDIFEVFLTSDETRLIVGMDIPGGIERLEVKSPDLGSLLFATPEPSTGFLLTAGLIGLAAGGRRRRS